MDVHKFPMTTELREMLTRRLVLVCDDTQYADLYEAFELAFMRTLEDDAAVRRSVATLLSATDNERSQLVAMMLRWREQTLADNPIMKFTHRLFHKILERNDRPSYACWTHALEAALKMIMAGYTDWEGEIPPIVTTSELARMQPGTGTQQ